MLEEYFALCPPVERPIMTSALSAVLLYISEHFTEDISLRSAAAALGYHPGSISHSLETLPGFNFNYLLNTMRIEYAKSLLLRTSFPLIDIALESGFQTERTFYRAFRQIAGISPGEYREKMHSEAGSLARE